MQDKMYVKNTTLLHDKSLLIDENITRPSFLRLDAHGVITLKKAAIDLEKLTYLIMPVPHSPPKKVLPAISGL